MYSVYKSVVSQVLHVWNKPDSKLHVQHVAQDQLGLDQMSMWVSQYSVVLVVLWHYVTVLFRFLFSFLIFTFKEVKFNTSFYI